MYPLLIILLSGLNSFVFNLELLPSVTIVKPDFYKHPLLLIKTILLVPIIEELAFRFHLIARSKYDYILSVILFIFTMLLGLLNFKLFSLLSLSLIFVLVSIGFLLKRYFSNQQLRKVSKFHHKHLTFMILSSSLVVGIYHCDEYFGKFSLDSIVFASMPFMLLGLIASWIAIKTGKLGPSILFHSLFNCLVALIAFLKDG